jgi:hypothetical protein
VTVIFPMDDEPFDVFMQRQAPEGWTIREAAGVCRYEITTDTGVAYEFTITTPDGRELWFHDCWNP